MFSCICVLCCLHRGEYPRSLNYSHMFTNLSAFDSLWTTLHILGSTGLCKYNKDPAFSLQKTTLTFSNNSPPTQFTQICISLEVFKCLFYFFCHLTLSSSSISLSSKVSANSRDSSLTMVISASILGNQARVIVILVVRGQNNPRQLSAKVGVFHDG